jgi:CMP-N-acetylneuraminic acid synthetase
MNILAIIPARGGSKGVKRKNIRTIDGKPLIAYTIEAANKSSLISRSIVSTEDKEISDVAKRYGADVPFIRSEKYATDEAKSIDVVFEVLDKCKKIFKEKYDLLVLLQPTSPFRDHTHIDNAIQMIIDQSEADSLVSVTEAANSCNPNYLYKSINGKYYAPLIDSEIIRRQELPIYYVRNGAIYIVRIDYLEKYRSFISKNNLIFKMDERVSVNIDTEMDLLFARVVAESKK